MTTSADSFVPTLPEELAAALGRATSETLNSLFSLRLALRDHVRAERADGATLSQIDGELREMIVTAGGDPTAAAYSVERVNELTTQVLKWSASFYLGRAR
ncbi:MAG TPA: hypothetical protein VJ865_07205 [Gemmatimonadaceae bacterium]|nr:hypothetical protein [Gemmatimonadaceae bacterium]